MTRRRLVLLSLVSSLLVALAVPAATGAPRQDPSVSFFSGGGEDARAHWVHREDDSPNDPDNLAIHIVTTPAPDGFAGAVFHHVDGIPTAAFQESSFEMKANQTGPSLGSPRLVVLFSDGGRAELRPLAWTGEWQSVQDPDWDNQGGTCGFLFEVTWDAVQACHAGTVVTGVFMVADPGRAVEFLVDKVNVGGMEVFMHARDNDRGNDA